MNTFELASKEAAATLMSVAAPLWFWKFWKQIENFGFFSEILKLLNQLVRRRRPLWCQWRPLCGFGNLGNKLKILQFFPEILKVLKTMKNFEKLWVIISKVRSKFWRWEGYIVSKFCTIWYRNEDYVNNLIICVFPVEISDCRALSLSRLTFF